MLIGQGLALAATLTSVQAKRPQRRSDFLDDIFKDGRLDHVAMDGLQFGWHHHLAADDARLVGKALAIASLDTGLLSSFVGHGTRSGE
jgi:hypothetical protein